MRSTKNRRAVIVGIVVALGLAILAVGIFTLGGQKKTFSSTFLLKAVFDDVNGLQRGNNILFSGVKVGTIRSVKFDPSAKVVVSMNVDEDVQRFIHRDALVKVSTDGLIGNKIVVIYGGTPAALQVASGDTLRVETVAGTEGLLDTLAQNNRNLLAITSNFKKLSDDITAGKGTAGRLLTRDDMANTLEAALRSMQVATRNAEALTANIARFSADLNRPGNFANDLVNDKEVFAKLRSSVNQLQEATDNIKSVSGKLNDVNSPVGVLLNDPQAAANLQSTLRNLNAGTAKLDTNMEALQHNFLLRGFFKKKRKAEAKAAENK
jgi:phospholipid/cholesterol/gamma-HCH transport system substrate-binding protein